ncbi:MAG: GPR endopeptidase [Clostridia bacterium]|nr:GPR endopeptidase [Clostridia bacterium]
MDIRTDLAVEAAGMKKAPVEGIESTVEEKGHIKIERIEIKSDEAARAIGKMKGTYVTITTRDLSENDKDEYEEMCMCVANELKSILNIEEKASVLAIGLGNNAITADSIGPESVKNLLVTRHIKELMPEEIDESVRSVSALAPSVMAFTGIETSEIVRGVTERVKPDLVIAIDALASRSMSRLGRTIQIADTGINPGSGVGNNRKELSEKTLGVRVIAIGVPMVVDAVTVALDAMDIAGATEDEKRVFFETYRRMEPLGADMVVTAKDVDSLAKRSSRIIANGINIALQSALGKEDIDRYTGF